MTRPICGHCGKPYGDRATESVTVRWESPSKKREHATRDMGGRSLAYFFVPDGEPLSPPPYRGNGIVTHQSAPYMNPTTGLMVMERRVWDGESYRGGYEPFCTLRCALSYARKAFKREKRA